MMKVFLVAFLSLIVAVGGLEEPIIYELARPDGYVVARTEVKPSVGDTYWDATTDTWYAVISVEGNRALMGTPAEAENAIRQRNLRVATGVAVLAGAAWYLRRRQLARKRL